jgi:SIR2-like domain
MTTYSESLFILGAGFTKAAFPKVPLNSDLLDALLKNGCKMLAKYHNLYKTHDIEKLLTQVDLELNGDDEKKQNRASINKEISSYFSSYRFSTASIPSWISPFALRVLKPNDSIICLNYDCFLEGALDYYEAWSPNGGYSRIENPNTISIRENPKNIMIYKIHGSEHFVESSVVGKNRDQTAIGFSIDSSIYPKSGTYRNFGGGALNPHPYIIAPSFVKIAHVDIAAMMLDVLKIAEKAKNLLIIGCGMRPEDNFLWLVLTRFLNKKTARSRKRLIILSPSSEDIWKRISNYWVGDIRSFTDAIMIPCGIENGLETVIKAVGDECNQIQKKG